MTSATRTPATLRFLKQAQLRATLLIGLACLIPVMGLAVSMLAQVSITPPSVSATVADAMIAHR